MDLLLLSCLSGLPNTAAKTNIENTQKSFSGVSRLRQLLLPCALWCLFLVLFVAFKLRVINGRRISFDNGAFIPSQMLPGLTVRMELDAVIEGLAECAFRSKRHCRKRAALASAMKCHLGFWSKRTHSIKEKLKGDRPSSQDFHLLMMKSVQKNLLSMKLYTFICIIFFVIHLQAVLRNLNAFKIIRFILYRLPWAASFRGRQRF